MHIWYVCGGGWSSTSCEVNHDFTLCFSINATISAIFCWHLSSVSSLFLMVSTAVNLSFPTWTKYIHLIFQFIRLKKTKWNLFYGTNLVWQLRCKCGFRLEVIKQSLSFFLMRFLKLLVLLLLNTDLHKGNTCLHYRVGLNIVYLHW